jgi:hypothetical protein
LRNEALNSGDILLIDARLLGKGRLGEILGLPEKFSAWPLPRYSEPNSFRFQRRQKHTNCFVSLGANAYDTSRHHLAILIRNPYDMLIDDLAFNA